MINLNKMKYLIFFLAVFSVFVFPSLSLAQQNGSIQPISSFSNNVPPILSFLTNDEANQPDSGTGTGNGSASGGGVTVVSCTLASPTTLGILFNYVACIISSSVIPLILALAVAMFVWGVFQYVIYSGEEAKKEKGRQFMLWGIIALAVMVCVWGLVSIIGNTFGIKNILPSAQNIQGQ